MSSESGTAAPLSLGAYATHRGCSKAAVSKAIKRGRLKGSVVLVGGQPKIADVELADREWTQNTDQSRTTVPSAPPTKKKVSAPPAAPNAASSAASQQRLREEAPAERPERKPGEAAPPLNPEDRWNVTDATAEERKWKALRAEIQYKQELGELIEAKDVEAVQAALFTIIRTKLLAVPGKARSNAPHLTLTDVALIDRLIRETLEELAGSDPPAPPDEGDDAASSAASSSGAPA